MSKHLSAVDRVELDQLLGAQRGTMDAMKAHQADCALCKPGLDWHRRACEVGWGLAKAHTAAAVAVRDFNRRGELAEVDGQLRLF